MGRSSVQSLYDGSTPPKPLNSITAQTNPTSKKSMAKKQTQSYISTKYGGGDPVTALALRPESSAQSITQRQGRLERELAESLSQL
ncbi:hypothetical protein PG991_011907 [Apiospora marii]|uniref:Uncharacterized protein n=1 Tax=Apiospora marii TaxID=335849 RepID=A0ABR1RFJ0_9PEZI